MAVEEAAEVVVSEATEGVASEAVGCCGVCTEAVLSEVGVRCGVEGRRKVWRRGQAEALLSVGGWRKL